MVKNVLATLGVVAVLLGVVFLGGNAFMKDHNWHLPSWSDVFGSDDPGTASHDGCVPVTPDNHTGFSVVSNRLSDDGLQIHNHYEDLAAIKGNPQALALRAYQLTLWPDANNWQPLVQGQCLSPLGVDTYNNVYNRLTGADSAVANVSIDDNAIAPTDLVNSGYGPDGAVINQSAGIAPNQPAIHYVITMRNGYVYDLYVLKHCGNPLFKKAPPGFKVVQIPNTPCQANCGAQPDCHQLGNCTCQQLGNCAPPDCHQNGTCSCQVYGNCGPPPNCHQLGNCSCQELGNCQPPDCHQLGNCSCEVLGNCGPPDCHVTGTCSCEVLGNCPAPKTIDNAPPLPQGGGAPNDQPGPGPSNVPTTPPPAPINQQPAPPPVVQGSPSAPSYEPSPVQAPPPAANVPPPAGAPGTNGNGSVTTHVGEPTGYIIPFNPTSQRDYTLAA